MDMSCTSKILTADTTQHWDMGRKKGVIITSTYQRSWWDASSAIHVELPHYWGRNRVDSVFHDVSPHYVLHNEVETKWLIFSRRHLKHIFSNQNVCVLILIQLKFVPKGSLDSQSALIQVIAWHRTWRQTYTWIAHNEVLRRLWHQQAFVSEPERTEGII